MSNTICQVWCKLRLKRSNYGQKAIWLNDQRWSRGHKARGQGHKKNPRPRPRTAFPRTDTLEAKDRNARGQGQGPRTQAQVLSKKKKGLHKNFSGNLRKKTFQKIFQALHKILTIQKILLSSSRGQANFRGLEASRPRPRTWPTRPRPRTSKSVLEAKDVLEDSTSVNNINLRFDLTTFTFHSLKRNNISVVTK